MFEKLFDVFSRREQRLTSAKIKPLTKEFRNRVLMLLRDTLQYELHAFLDGLQQKAAYLYGKFGLSETSTHSSPEDDLLNFFATCSDESFLDLIELFFDPICPVSNGQIIRSFQVLTSFSVLMPFLIA